MIGYGPTSRLYGRKIAYSDTYLRPGEPTYVYARHSAEPVKFFRILDYFLLQQLEEFPELKGREFDLLLNRAGAATEVSICLPFSTSLSLDALAFVRIYLPFGDISIEFDEITLTVDELNPLREQMLTRGLERPLVGFDMTKYHLLAKLMAELHWASGIVPQSILEGLIEQFSFSPVPA